MDDSIEAHWRFVAASAQALDEAKPVSTQATMSALVDAASRTTLRRFCPFTSQNSLRFAKVAQWWARRDSVAPAFIALSQEDSVVVYGVWAQQASGDLALVMKTTQPAEAAARLEQMLVNWPRS